MTPEYPFDRQIPLREETLDDVAQSISPQQVQQFKRTATLLEQEWQKIEELAVHDIVTYLGIPVSHLHAHAALTTAYLMPYDAHNQWFMVPATKPLSAQLRTIIHELFHLYHLQKNPRAMQQELESTVENFLREHADQLLRRRDGAENGG